MRPRDPVELLIERIWSEVLGQRCVDVRADFRRLGGDEDARRRMLARVAQETQIGTLPQAASRSETVETLASVLKRSSKPLRRKARAFWARNVDGPPETARPPLFFFHGMPGGLEWLQALDQLGRGQPVYGIAPHFASAETIPDTLEAIAGDHLRLVRAIQPDGPYLLGGFCNGAVAAFEAARQLRAAGEAVIGIVLFAPRLPATYRRGPFGLLIRLTLRPLDVGFGRIHRLGLRHRLWRALGQTPGPAWRHQVLLPREREDPAMALRYADIYEAYVPRPLDVPATIFWPRGEPLRCRIPSQRAWRRALPAARVVGVPGRHSDCTRARATARELRRAIDLFGAREDVDGSDAGAREPARMP